LPSVMFSRRVLGILRAKALALKKATNSRVTRGQPKG
jgi:hypothetical protein